MSEPVLFLGGPLHGQHRAIPADRWNVVVPIPPGPIFALAEAEPLEMREVVYTSRRMPGSGERVFVAPDYRFDTVEWVTAAMPDVTGWEHLGERRWRGRRGDPLSRPSWLYVLCDEQGRGYVGTSVTVEFVEDFAGDVDTVVFEELQDKLDYERLPPCVVPGCEEKAPMVFTAAEHGKLAGKEWRRGQEIRLCRRHADDVYRAQGAYGPDQLAEWLRPDARLDPLDAFAADYGSLNDSEIHNSRSRMLRLKQRGE
jgi:hypothetical protein